MGPAPLSFISAFAAAQTDCQPASRRLACPRPFPSPIVFRPSGYLQFHPLQDCHDYLLLDLVALLDLDLLHVGVERSFDWCCVGILLKSAMQSRLNKNGVLTVQELLHCIHRYLTRFLLLCPLLQHLFLLVQLCLCFLKSLQRLELFLGIHGRHGRSRLRAESFCNTWEASIDGEV